MWVARDKGGKLFLYKDKPIRELSIFVCNFTFDTKGHKDVFPFMIINEEQFSDLKWEDEPIEVELVRK